MKWQTIESAPKTGEKILLAYKGSLDDWTVIIGGFVMQEEIDAHFQDCIEEGWYERSESPELMTGTIYKTFSEPTHWHPLPKPKEL